MLSKAVDMAQAQGIDILHFEEGNPSMNDSDKEVLKGMGIHATWDSPLLKKADAFNIELSQPYKPYYDKKYQTAPTRDGGNPFAGKRNEEDQMVTATDPIQPEHHEELSKKDKEWKGMMGVKSSLLQRANRFRDPDSKPPRYELRNRQNQGVKTEIAKEEGTNEEKREERDPDLKTASLRSLARVDPSFEMFDQCVKVHIPKTAKRFELTAKKINQMENEISKALNVRAKYDNLSFSNKIDGISLEFLLV
jgi:hypothetical protein